ncbi:apolipoprotein N-acyltransferase [Haloferula rosea]|uniref:Apolipoprotein N-acyltransferase n=1 Tax=Haloferula rosea TaxID=490093 RepID=A0A934RBA7_9BACT|nr:apolipoprotein N-acyltransferase [Haloferula rosea]MBK1827483.1 apolipoprotein N-acyltransferase [Haloferula rosea]
MAGSSPRGGGVLRIGAAVVTGGIIGLLFPPFNWAGWVWVCLLPLFIAIWSAKGRRGWKGFGMGWLAGFVASLVSLHWLTEVTSVGWVALAAYLGIFPGVWGLLIGKWVNPWKPKEEEGKKDSAIQRKVRAKVGKAADPKSHWRASWDSLIFAFAAASTWCGLEWLRGWLFTGFGWNSLGVAFHETPVMAQSADLLGICGLSFLPVFLQAVLVQTGVRLWAETKRGRLKPHVDFGVAAMLIAVAFCYGVWRLHTVPQGEHVRLKVLLVQLNVPQDAAKRLWSPEEIHFGYEEETLEALEEIERQDASRFEEAAALGQEIRLNTPDWIIWPESALYGRILRIGDEDWAMWGQNLETLARIREQGTFTLAMGLNEVEGERLGQDFVEKVDARLWNSLAVFDESSELLTYRKHHLVIFGEYIPLVETLPFLKAIYEQQSGASYGGAFAKGESFDPLMVEAAGESVGLIPSVCFEDTVPRLMRRFIRQGPQWIVNVTNDGWFRESPGAAQHFANARFRAIELRRPMVRSANNGVSAAVNPLGSTAHPDGGPPQELRDENGSHFTRGWLLAEVDIPKEPSLTLYMLIGDLGVVMLGLSGLVVGIWKGRRG